MAKSDYVFDVTEADFETKVIKKSQEVPVIVDFWAPWCGPCRTLAPVLKKAIDGCNFAVLLAKVNIDEEQNLAAAYQVSSIPLVLGFRKGRPVVQFLGLVSEAELAEFFERLQPSEAEKNAELAAQLEQTDAIQAEVMYRAALEKKSDQEDAIVGLARLLLPQKKYDEASDLLDRIGSAGECGAEADKLRALLWLQVQAKDLPSVEELRKKVKADPKNAQALCDLGCVLAANGETTEALETLLQAGQLDRKLVASRIKETMVKIFFVVGVRSETADTYRDKLTRMLY